MPFGQEPLTVHIRIDDLRILQASIVLTGPAGGTRPCCAGENKGGVRADRTQSEENVFRLLAIALTLAVL